MIKKIVSHSGTFHADEISGIALLLNLFPGTPVERTFTPSEEDLADPNVIVLDIGRRFEPRNHNFDHHQDADLNAANILVLRHFVHDARLQEVLEQNLFLYISAVDCGEIVDKSYSTISGIIRACNNLPDGFNQALALMQTVIESAIETAKRQIEAENTWAEKVLKLGQVAIHDSTEFIVGWQELAEKDGINFLVTPNQRGGYQITSRDSKTHNIPPDPRQTFRHNSGFLAAYATMKDAVDHAKEL